MKNKLKLNIVVAILLIAILLLPTIQTLLIYLLMGFNLKGLLSSLISVFVKDVIFGIPYIIMIVGLFKNKRSTIRYCLIPTFALALFCVFSEIVVLNCSYLFVIQLAAIGILFALTFVQKNKDNVKWLWKTPVFMFAFCALIPFCNYVFGFLSSLYIKFDLGFFWSLILNILNIIEILLYPTVWCLLTYWILGPEKKISDKDVNKSKLSNKNESKEEKIKALRSLYQSGGITEEEYKKKMVRLLKNKN